MVLVGAAAAANEDDDDNDPEEVVGLPFETLASPIIIGVPERDVVMARWRSIEQGWC